MKEHRLATLAISSLVACLAGGTAQANEWPTDSVIVVSDNWCSPQINSPSNPDIEHSCLRCDPGRPVRRARCSGNYCDNNILQCGVMPSVNGVQLKLATGDYWARYYQTMYTSDENGGKDRTDARCPAGYAMVGMRSNGNNSDNIASYCSQVTNIPTGRTPYLTQFSSPISDENGWTHDLSQQWWILWLNGPSCTGSSCDNMYYWYTQIM